MPSDFPQPDTVPITLGLVLPYSCVKYKKQTKYTNKKTLKLEQVTQGHNFSVQQKLTQQCKATILQFLKKASEFSSWDPPLYLLLSVLTGVNRVFSISANAWLNFQRGKQKNIAVSTFIYQSYEIHMCYKCPQTVLS